MVVVRVFGWCLRTLLMTCATLYVLGFTLTALGNIQIEHLVQSLFAIYAYGSTACMFGDFEISPLQSLLAAYVHGSTVFMIVYVEIWSLRNRLQRAPGLSDPPHS